MVLEAAYIDPATGPAASLKSQPHFVPLFRLYEEREEKDRPL
jgi:hypothetical protein